MVCPECGTDHPEECPQPQTAAATTLPYNELELALDQTAAESTTVEVAESSVAQSTSRLIEFPGVIRRSVPPWRKELSERVREVQERRAHEAEAEAAERRGADSADIPSPQLELLPQAEAMAVNPLVAAALKRIERAHQPSVPDQRPSYPASLSVAAGAANPGTNFNEAGQELNHTRRAVAASRFDDRRNDPNTAVTAGPTNPAVAVAAIQVNEPFSVAEKEPAPERAVNLVVVPTTPVVAEAKPSIAEAPAPEVAETRSKPKPKRIITDDASDPALNYLDLIGVSCAEADAQNRASLFSRIVSGVIDLITVGFLSVPFAAAVELRNGNWRDPRVMAFMASGTIVVMFLYLTVSTALTGRTLGLRLLSMRVIDTRTRLIPTGAQAAGRAVVYILSLATAGVGFLFALARGEGKTVHDRFSRTAVVRD